MSERTWHVHGERTLRTARTGPVVVEPGAVLWLRATVTGDVRVGPGARCHVLAEVRGTVLVEGGTVVVGATVHGGVRRGAGTSSSSVREAGPRRRGGAEPPRPPSLSRARSIAG